ncbi:MAG: endonuclease III [Nitrospirales bacterium]|nr:MAG: endonuclease III [Nitrospirales bacterium]
MQDEDIHAVIRVVKQEVRQWPSALLGVLAAESSSPFQILITCILSLRTKDDVTAPAARRLFSLAANPLEMRHLEREVIERAIHPVGFYRTKSNQILDICQRLITVYHGNVPDSIEELLTLNGVGRKTANLVVTIGFGKPGICVDVHVHRICNRWGYIKTQDPDESESVLRKKLPRRYWIHFNDLLVPFGQNLCKPISPHCSSCRLQNNYCASVGVTSFR